MQDGPDFLLHKRALQAFQSQRLGRAYADLRHDPEFAGIGAFFFTRLYGPEDFSFRDTSIRTLHRVLDGRIHGGMLAAVSAVIELHEVSDALDDRMTALMLADGLGPELELARYRDIYRRLDNYGERIRQIDLSCRAVRLFHRLSRKWIVGVSLKTVRATAGLLGIGPVMEFVYDGYDAFRKIGQIDFFVETIERREKAWHDELWAGASAGGGSA